MNSIRVRLIAVLIATTGVMWLSAVGWIYISTQTEVERVLDARLMEAARMVNSLITDHRIEVAMAAAAVSDAPTPFEPAAEDYKRQLSCQIWSFSGALVGQSEGAPDEKLSGEQAGFSETVIDGETWRVFAVENARLGVRVMVGDNIEIRDRLVNDVIKGLLLPAALILPLIAVLIWFSVRRGLSPLDRMAEVLSGRAADDLRPIPAMDAPIELKPALGALNGLFRRVEDARLRERSFTAFAAHELKTPLAGLKTQAQIALASSDPEIKLHALSQIVSGVDRSARLVRQLLDLAAIEASDAAPLPQPVDLPSLLLGVIAELDPVATARFVRIENHAESGITGTAEPNFLAVAIRNVVENAILHSPPGGRVLCALEDENGAVAIRIEDEGPGMDAEEIHHATERFYRGRNRQVAGNGLGLAIVETAVRRFGGSLLIENRKQGGLRVTLGLPKASAPQGR